jgi:hypothetical protein
MTKMTDTIVNPRFFQNDVRKYHPHHNFWGWYFWVSIVFWSEARPRSIERGANRAFARSPRSIEERAKTARLRNYLTFERFDGKPVERSNEQKGDRSEQTLAQGIYTAGAYLIGSENTVI